MTEMGLLMAKEKLDEAHRCVTQTISLLIFKQIAHVVPPAISADRSMATKPPPRPRAVPASRAIRSLLVQPRPPGRGQNLPAQNYNADSLFSLLQADIIR